jgi:hypothetical protein
MNLCALLELDDSCGGCDAAYQRGDPKRRDWLKSILNMLSMVPKYATTRFPPERHAYASSVRTGPGLVSR